MGRRTTRRWLAGLVAAAVVLAGCASTEDERPGGSQESTQGGSGLLANGMVGVSEPAGDPTSGGTLTFATYSEARSLDPAVTIATGASGGIEMAAVYDVLLRYDAGSGEYVPRLAKSFEPDDDHSTWTLELREGVTFSDGTPMDAQAVVASIERYLSERGEQTYL